MVRIVIMFVAFFEVEMGSMAHYIASMHCGITTIAKHLGGQLLGNILIRFYFMKIC